MAGRFIKLYDKILSWEWYKNINVKVLFLHLLLKANYKDLSFEGHTIQRGQLVTSLPSLSAELGMTTKQVRGSLDHLIATGEVTSKAYPRYRIITIVHYDDYQANDSLEGSQRAGERAVKRQAEGRLRAGSGQAEGSQRAASIEYIEQVEQIEKKEQVERVSAKRFTPPTKEEILDYCLENGLSFDIDYMYDYYTAKGWKIGNGNQTMKDWQAAVRNWARREQRGPGEKPTAPVKKVAAQQYSQRDYGDEDDEAFNRMMKMYGEE